MLFFYLQLNSINNMTNEKNGMLNEKIDKKTCQIKTIYRNPNCNNNYYDYNLAMMMIYR